MAFGLSPKYVQDLALENLTPEQFLVLTIEAAKKLGWNLGYTSENGFVAFTNFSMSSWSEEVKVKIDGKNANLKSECTGNQMVDWGKNKENIEKLIATFRQLKNAITTEELAQKYEELKPGLISQEQDVLSQSPATTKEKITSIFAIFKPIEGYFITPIIINLNIALFILMTISGVNIMLPDNESLINWGANFRPVTLEGGWWRLITSCFLHIGILHLLLNMYALLYIGLLLEPHLGKIRFATAYLLTGIVASMTSLYWHDLTISAGASGAIFGMYGVFLAMLTTNLIEKSARNALVTSIAIFVGYNLVNGLKGGIDNAAHIGGLISGIVIGYALIPSLKKPADTKLAYSTLGLLAAFVLVSSFVVFGQIPNEMGPYDAKMKDFALLEEKALKVYSLPENTPNEKILYGLKEEGIYYWKEGIKLIDSFEEMDLPAEIKSQNELLKEYCELRIKSYELLYKAVSENTDQYEQQIEAYNSLIETKIKELGGGEQTE
ncbi:MAG: rhomboid family intramembrane serine protease [Bacteroidia bacterium]